MFTSCRVVYPCHIWYDEHIMNRNYIIKIIFTSLLCVHVFPYQGNTETFWEKRKKAYERLKTDQEDSISTPVKRSKKFGQKIIYTSSKEKFGIK